jgi:CRISPR system Cascade subunit CasE
MLKMLVLPFDANQLEAWATKRGLMAAGEFCDKAYATHSAFLAAIGTFAPRCCALRSSPQGGLELVAYSRFDESEFDRARSEFSKADVESVFDWENMTLRPLPELGAGKDITFFVRIRPIVRRSIADSFSGRQRDIEVDAYLAAVESDKDADRELVYINWLSKKLGHDLPISNVKIEKFQISDILIAVKWGKRQFIKGPDVSLHGKMIINDIARFEEMLLSGIGRHKANGYGLVSFKV